MYIYTHRHIQQAAGERLGERIEYSEIHAEVVFDDDTVMWNFDQTATILGKILHCVQSSGPNVAANHLSPQKPLQLATWCLD